MKLARVVFILTLVSTLSAATKDAPVAGGLPWSQRAANAAIQRWPEGRFVPAGAPSIWNYELGTLLEGMDAVWLNTADGRYVSYIRSSVDTFIGPDGSIATWKPEEKQLDNILLGRQLLLLYGVTREPRYAKAATLLWQQLMTQPRTPSGGFWHKQRYPNQMWLDGFYMAEPFYAEYAATFHHPEAFSDITHQFAVMDEHARDPKTGLLYHGWDESKQERWANKETGLSSQFWGRAMGWYMMALVDTLAWYPKDDPGRNELLSQLRRDAEAVAKVQDQATGLWYLVLDKPGAPGNYFESSASCMFVYALAEGARRGYLDPRYLEVAQRGYQGILGHFARTEGDDVSLTDTVKGAGLGGNPYRDGSYEYYVGEKVATNDAKGVGAFLLASSEMETADRVSLGRGNTVLVDAWFNSQKRSGPFGQEELFHYKWDDESDSGYSLFGHIFRSFGANTDTLTSAPTANALRGAQVYIIVSPDTPAKNPNPHFIQSADAEQIVAWVRAGGVLMIMGNDPANTDLNGLNTLGAKFGIHYNDVLRKHVEGTHWEMGKVAISGEGPIFHQPHTMYVKDVSTLSLSAPAIPQLTDAGEILMATAKYGKGTVYAMVDPWLYNEYTDGRKLPQEYDNYAAGVEVVRWILTQVPHAQPSHR
jgi:unsaturated rhamnogalacturonyl hydrolase